MGGSSAFECRHLHGYGRESDYGFRDQITRSGLSVPSNIAEGMERPSRKERVRFVNYAQGSCAELRTQIYIGINIGYIPRDTGKHWVQESKEIAAMLVGLCRAIEKAEDNT